MREFFRKSIIFFMIFMLAIMPVSAKDSIKIIADMNDGFTLNNKEIPKEITFIAAKSETINDAIRIPEDSKVTVEVIGAEQERRWHKSGVIIGKLKSYCPEGVSEPIDVSYRDIYLIMRKYERIVGKDAAILTAEIIFTQAAGIVGSCFVVFAPVDIAYFFAKGAIKRQKHPNWFKAGVRDAYDNSIFWFWLKGKPIELNPDDLAKAKNITPKKAQKLVKGMEKRNLKREARCEKRIEKLNKKFAKREYKYEKKTVNCSVVEQAIEAELAEEI